MLLLDNNLSPKLAKRLQYIFPGIIHLQDFGLEAANDSTVWDFAKANGFHILTKDKDFNHLILVRGFPPKVVQLVCGNASTNQIEALLLKEAPEIQSFMDNPDFGLMIIQ